MKSQVLLKELREKDIRALIKEMEQAKNKITELKFQASFKKLKNYKAIQNERKKIARIWTVLTQKTLEQIKKEEND